ncbi:MAG: hypothetical protein Tsb005_11690 [Gammaproteobacteria bacterium]
MNATSHNVVILIAMRAEAQPIIDRLVMQPDMTLNQQSSPLEFFKSTLNNINFYVVINGFCPVYGVDRVGTQAAAISAWESIRLLKPVLIINAGTAGGFTQHNHHIGDVLLGQRVCYHDRRIPLAGFDVFGTGNYRCIVPKQLRSQLNLSLGNISTGNALDFTDTDLQIMQANQAHLKEMEAAAIAEVAALKNIPLMCLKAITDFIDAPETISHQFIKNLQLASMNLADKLQQITEFIASRPIEALLTDDLED